MEEWTWEGVEEEHNGRMDNVDASMDSRRSSISSQTDKKRPTDLQYVSYGVSLNDIPEQK